MRAAAADPAAAAGRPPQPQAPAGGSGSGGGGRCAAAMRRDSWGDSRWQAHAADERVATSWSAHAWRGPSSQPMLAAAAHRLRLWLAPGTSIGLSFGSNAASSLRCLRSLGRRGCCNSRPLSLHRRVVVHLSGVVCKSQKRWGACGCPWLHKARNTLWPARWPLRPLQMRTSTLQCAMCIQFQGRHATRTYASREKSRRNKK